MRAAHHDQSDRFPRRPVSVGMLALNYIRHAAGCSGPPRRNVRLVIRYYDFYGRLSLALSAFLPGIPTYGWVFIFFPLSVARIVGAAREPVVVHLPRTYLWSEL